VVVGYGSIHATNTKIGYRWMKGHLEEIEPLSGGTSTSPNAVSVDGGTVVGTADDTHAFIWTDADGTRTLIEELEERGYEPPSDLQLQNAFFIFGRRKNYRWRRFSQYADVLACDSRLNA
jgi:hypothetical protein